jgi:hypothetical protein
MAMLLVLGMIATPDGADTISLLGSWGTGTSHTQQTGTNRALIFITHAENTSSINLGAVSYGGQAMLKSR